MLLVGCQSTEADFDPCPRLPHDGRPDTDEPENPPAPAQPDDSRDAVEYACPWETRVEILEFLHECLGDGSDDCPEATRITVDLEVSVPEDRDVPLGVLDWTFGGSWDNVTGLAAQTAIEVRAGQPETATLTFVQEGPCTPQEGDRAQVQLWIEGMSGSFALDAESVQGEDCPATLEE